MNSCFNIYKGLIIPLILSIFALSFEYSSAQVLKTLSTNDTTYQYTDAAFELLSAASEGDTSKIIAFLDLGTDVNSTNWDGVTPLMYAAQNGLLRSVEILLHHGAKVNMKPYSQIDALTGACIGGYALIADTLILNGANVESRNNDGLTPLMWAAGYGHELLADVLIFYTAKINKADNFGNTPLHFSCFYDNPETTAILLENGAITDAVDMNGFTPLMLAAQNGHIDNLGLLIQYGADLNKTNDEHLNALALAIINRQDHAVHFLLQAGADPTNFENHNLNLYDLSVLLDNKSAEVILDSAGLRPEKKFIIHQWGFHSLMDFNSKDLMLGGSFTLSEAIYGLGFEAGFRMRPAVRSVLLDENAQTSWQYWEKRSIIHVAIEKKIALLHFQMNRQINAIASLGLGYTYGRFRGSSRKPNDQMLFIPELGFEYVWDFVSLKLNYEFIKLKHSKSPASRIEVRFGINFNLYQNKFHLKEEPL